MNATHGKFGYDCSKDERSTSFGERAPSDCLFAQNEFPREQGEEKKFLSGQKPAGSESFNSSLATSDMRSCSHSSPSQTSVVRGHKLPIAQSHDRRLASEFHVDDEERYKLSNNPGADRSLETKPFNARGDNRSRCEMKELRSSDLVTIATHGKHCDGRSDRFDKRQGDRAERRRLEARSEISASGTEKAVGATERRVEEGVPVTHDPNEVTKVPDDVSSADECQMRDDDLAELAYIDDNILVQHIGDRYNNDQPYTYVGDSLVAVNPCRDLPIYTLEHHDKYDGLGSRARLPAHIFWVADQAYRNLQATASSQCVVVGGESGAGKTESTKLILRHLVSADSCRQVHQARGAVASHTVANLDKVSPLLEIFGNASTTLNENSSRFGKLVELDYHNGRISAARLEGFLLEKYRVTTRNPREKNFHVFYALFAGLSERDLSRLGLLDPNSFRILRCGNSTEPVFGNEIEKHRYGNLYHQMHAMLTEIGFTHTEIQSLLNVLVAILLVSNLEFVKDADLNAVGVAKDRHKNCLTDVAALLNLPDEELETCLLQVTTQVKGERITRNKNEAQAKTGRDAVARELYSMLFYGIIDRINSRLFQGVAGAESQRNQGIALLDISGFENGEASNGFEQFVINATNEKLHQYFLQQMFVEERREYEREGLQTLDVAFSDNSDVVDLIFKAPSGLIPLLEDQNALNGSDADWLLTCRRHHPHKDIFPDRKLWKDGRLAFAIKHYAGQVIYTAVDFVEKNSDTLPGNLLEFIQRSDNTFIRDYFSSESDALPSQRRYVSISADSQSKHLVGRLHGCFTEQFQISLSRMMSKLRKSTPIFVRCIKPNQTLKPKIFDRKLVCAQLQHSGLLEVAIVRKHGYPIRIKFSDFIDRYRGICDIQKDDHVASTQKVVTCRNILHAACVEGYQLGRTKVFLKMPHGDRLENELKKKQTKDNNARDFPEGMCRPETESPAPGAAFDGFPAAKDFDAPDTQSLQSSSGFSSASASALASREGLVDGTQIPEPGSPERNGSAEKSETTCDTNSGEAAEAGGEQPAYDVFRLTERDQDNSRDCEMKTRRCVRLFLYILIFIFLLATGLIARLSMMWLASPTLKKQERLEVIAVKAVMGGKPKEKEVGDFLEGLAPARILACQLLPLVLGWIACCLRVAFARRDWPTYKALVVVTIIDCMGTAGRSVFLFKVLPSVDMLVAVCLGTAVCQVPGVLKIVSLVSQLTGHHSQDSVDRKARRRAKVMRYAYLVAVILAVVVQLGFVPALLYCDAAVAHFRPSSHTTPLPELWAMVVVVVGVSASWWQNFAFGQIWCRADIGHLSSWRTSMSRVRLTSHVYTGPLQIAVALAIFYGFHHSDDVDLAEQLRVFFASVGHVFSGSGHVSAHWTMYGLMYMQIASVLLCCYVAGLACRLYMQRVAFALPVTLVPPATLALVAGCTPSRISRWFHTSNACVTQDFTQPHVLFVLTLGVVVWLSGAIITAHVWLPEVERTAKHERLFAFPHRDPVFTDVCLACSRRQDKAENAERKQRQEKSDRRKNENGVERPMVYICATMWHEIRQEMLQLMKSLFRVDFDIFTRKKAVKAFNVSEENSDLYDAEIHIIFDDAFDTEPKSRQRVLNQWVRQFIAVMPEAARSVAKQVLNIEPPKMYSTPFGGRMTWELPGGTQMHVHLKDKDRIRHRKRWSQILYLYYLLGFKLMGTYDTVKDVLEKDSSTGLRRRRHRVRANTSILNTLPPEKVRQAENIFIMTLDGDVDFRPDSVRLLLDRMKKNKKVAAVCGRIHPIGGGPMVWYQQFEYAVGHWLQKATEHVFGCVLCCPGCFSLFRGSALIDDNVMRMYTTEPTEAVHFIQYEQGEDRWLCTLLLQQGYKIEYCAGADALTFAPETFHDFYIQRRRWSPSTMANIMDLIGSWRVTVKTNDNISVLFMMYQFVLLASSIIAPGTVVYMIAGSYSAVLGIDLWKSYLLSVIPVFLYILLCLKAKTETQINVAAILSSVYAIVMLLVTVGTIINVATSSIYSPTVLFLVGVAVIFVVAGLLHPNEIFCLCSGILYYITVPSTFVFLTVFFLCNLHVVTWGTREGPKKVDDATSQVQPEQQEGKLYKFFQKLGLQAIIQDIKIFAHQVVGIRQELTDKAHQPQQPHQKANGSPQTPSRIPTPRPPDAAVQTPPPAPAPPVHLDATYWAKDLKNSLTGSAVERIDDKEEKFWNFLLHKYLHPIQANKDKQDKISEDLITARNNVVFAYMLINLMFTLVLLQLKLQMDVLKDTFYIAGKYEPVSTLALVLFSLLLLTQFLGMLSHRWSTFMHLIASTRLTLFKDDDDEQALAAVKEAQRLTTAAATGDLHLDLPPDYSDIEEDFDVDTGTNTTETLPTDRQTIEEIEEAPDYPDSENEEDEVGGTQYDRMFQRRFLTAQRHMLRQERRQAALHTRNNPPVVSANKQHREFQRRHSLYKTHRRPRQVQRV